MPWIGRRLSRPFETVGSFIEYSLSVQNRRKARLPDAARRCDARDAGHGKGGFHRKAERGGGGTQETAAKNLSRQALLAILRKLAGYVQITAQTREDVLSAGFDTRSTNNAREPLPKPTGVTVKNGTAGQLVGRLGHPIKNTNLYEGRAKLEGTDTWLPSVFTGDSRHIIFPGLTPGAMYTIEIRALGGSTGQSDWSDPVSHRSM